MIYVHSIHNHILTSYGYLYPATSDKVCQLLAQGRGFSPGTLASSITKTGRHDIAEILLKVGLNTIKPTNQPIEPH
jgi:hypothetical protein